MLYILLEKTQIKLLNVKKSLLGQYDAAFFQKKFQMDLITNGKLVNLDLVASAIKEALNTMLPTPLKEKEVTLILPQECFSFFRTEMPIDITQSVLNSYLREKARSQINLDVDTTLYDYLIQENEDKKQILFFAIDRENADAFEQPFKLLDLKITSIIPESLTYFKLFEKTLRKDKKENIFYASYEKDVLFGHVYDSFGLLDAEKWIQPIKADDSIENILKDKAIDYETQGKKLNRLILSGEMSENIRQDTFTKQVGVWTNPLKRIIPNFYQDYMKMLNTGNEALPILTYDACVGAFIFAFENKGFSFFNTNNNKQVKTKSESKMPSMSMPSLPSVSIPVKPILLFLASFGLSFALFFFVSKAGFSGFSFSMPKIDMNLAKATPTTAPSPSPVEPSPTPTPAVDRAKVKIKVLNGSGIKGKASVVKDLLNEKGYEQILTGNADDFDYETTEIQIKDGHDELKKIITEDLSDNVSSPDFTELDEAQASDVIIIVGTDFK